MLTAVITVALGCPRSGAVRAKEAALSEDLRTLRSCIDQYFAVNRAYPVSLEELVEKKYIRKVPADPFTRKAEWVLVRSGDGRVIDVRSAYRGRALDGSRYERW